MMFEGKGMKTVKTFEDEVISTGEALARVQDLVASVTRCAPNDAEEVMSALLEEIRIGPPSVAYMPVEDEAEFWASMSTYDELVAYFIACGRRLVRRQRGAAGRKRLVQRLLLEVDEPEREQFMTDALRDLPDLIERG